MWCYVVMRRGKRETLAENGTAGQCWFRRGVVKLQKSSLDVEVWQEAACSGACIHLPITN